MLPILVIDPSDNKNTPINVIYTDLLGYNDETNEQSFLDHVEAHKDTLGLVLLVSNIGVESAHYMRVITEKYPDIQCEMAKTIGNDKDVEHHRTLFNFALRVISEFNIGVAEK